jgi:hypothetical protein
LRNKITQNSFGRLSSGVASPTSIQRMDYSPAL